MLDGRADSWSEGCRPLSCRLERSSMGLLRCPNLHHPRRKVTPVRRSSASARCLIVTFPCIPGFSIA